jgi:hypothetical protein
MMGSVHVTEEQRDVLLPEPTSDAQGLDLQKNAPGLAFKTWGEWSC